ncbi:delta 8-sphingoloid desaturase protein [Coprinopsis marcescibilis]|uniref:Delta 8-(E)-sphingolipid desaturase n=1 Tax=Coprinopsis marcescibilis TaxID=230819 RepID=A0A5C3LBA4_COPMA|nr:delta 8-sphingoloid desaturase protein [Coprinopsis marcescibilis]
MPTDRDQLWSTDAVAAAILDGQTLIVYRDKLLRIPDKWLTAHPGGNLALLHLVGRDATDEIEAYHSDETLALVPRYSVGRVQNTLDKPWVPFVPPLMSGWVRRPDSQGKQSWFREAQDQRSQVNTEDSPSSQIMVLPTDAQSLSEKGPTIATITAPPSNLSLTQQAQHSKAYRELHQRVTDADLYKTPYITGYGPEVARYILFACVSVYAYSNQWFKTSALFLGFLWHQLVFTAHDLGHMGVTHDWALDRLIAIGIADFIGGLSIGWWVNNHNVHHIVTNHPSHDPDIQHIPFFAISTQFFSSLWSSYYKKTMALDGPAKYLISIQHKLFYIVMSLARFNLYSNSYLYLYQKAFDTQRARGGKWAFRLEVLGIVVFWTWYSRVLYNTGSWQNALIYLLISNVTPSPLHVQIVLSHFSMSTADLGPTESFPHRQLRTTTDVICPDSIGFIHGGLQLQVTHHLFPRLPRHNLRKASVLVKQYCQEQGLDYAEFGFIDGNMDVIGVLRNVAEQVKIVGKVANAEVHEAVEKSAIALEKQGNSG